MTNIKESAKSNKAATHTLPDGLLAIVKLSRPILIVAGVFYLIGSLSVLISPEQVAREAIGFNYTEAELTLIRLAGIVLLVASVLFFYSAKLIDPAATLRQLRLGSILALLTALLSIGGSQNLFSIVVLLIIAVPVIIIGWQAHRLLQHKTDAGDSQPS